MKILISFIFLFILNHLALAKCPDNFSGVSIRGLYHSGYSDEPIEEFYYMLHTESDVNLTKDEFSKIPVLNTDFKFEFCKEAITKVTFSDIETGAFFTAYYTNDDECDGGNSYGSIFNADGIYIADILDGDFQCLSNASSLVPNP